MDTPLDGPFVVACLGDSNSLTRDGVRSWVDLTREALKGTRFELVNRAEIGASTNKFYRVPNAWLQLEQTLTKERPDLVILSFGTNDIAWQCAANGSRARDALGKIVREHQELATIVQTSGAAAAVALTPAVFGDTGQEQLRQELTVLLNDHLARVFPPELVLDFHTPSLVPGALEDALHLSQAGQEHRAAVAIDWLKRLRIDSSGQLCLPRPSYRLGPAPRSEGISDLLMEAFTWPLRRRVQRLARSVGAERKHVRHR